MSESEEPTPVTRIYALIVGIEEYDSKRQIRPLPGAAIASRRFRKWLLRNGVPQEQIFMHVSPRNSGEEAAKLQAILESIEKDRKAAAEADILYIYWG